MRKLTALFVLICLSFSILFPGPALADRLLSESRAMLDYKVTPEVIYGTGEIVENGEPVFRKLWMDFYEPLAETKKPPTKKPRPAIVFTHGGSFHRGSPRYTYNEGGAQDTSPADYCRKFATRGYACFAIAYRLAPENPVPSGEGYSSEDLDFTNVKLMLDHVNKVRKVMGLDPLDPENPEDIELLNDALLSAAEDLRTAVRHIRKWAHKYNIDPKRIVLGGFSAGAVTSLNVAHGMHEPVASAFFLSVADIGFDIFKTVTSPDSPPVLMFQGQNDLDATFASMPDLMKHYEKVGVPYEFAWVPSFGHFYTSGATSLSGDGLRMSVEDRIVQFLEETLGGDSDDLRR